MRTSLLPGLLRAVAHAERRGSRDAKIFTVGSLFLPALVGPRGAKEAHELPQERLALAAVIAGDRPGWLRKPEAVDVWDAKGVAEALVSRILRRALSLRVPTDAERPRALHPRGASFIEVEQTRLGSFGPLHPDVADAFGITSPAVIVEIDLDAAAALGPERVRFSPLPRFPPSMRDLAIVVADTVAAGEVSRAAREVAGDLADEVVLFDRFTGGGVPVGHASLGVHIVYRASDRTLTDAEVDARHGQVVAALEKQFGGTLRG
jgi:phenylalanyl-tRNA synthetase beta chain